MKMSAHQLTRYTACLASVLVGSICSVNNRAMAQDELSGLFGTITVTDISAFPEITMFTTLRDSDGQNIELCPSSSFSLREFDTVTGDVITVDDLEVTLLPTLPGTAISVALVMDTSGSLGSSGAAQARMAATEFVAQLQPQDRAAIVDFDNDVTILQTFTNDNLQLLDAIDLLDSSGSTSMYDGGVVGLQETAGEAGNRNIILFTDGGENDSIATFDELIQLSRDLLIPIHTIAIGNADEQDLEEIAQLTNGTFRRGELGELGTLYTEITNQIRSQYRLVFSSPNGAQVNRERRLELQIVCEGFDTFANTGYVSRSALQINPTQATRDLLSGNGEAAEATDLSLSFTITGDPISARLLYRQIGETTYLEQDMATDDGQQYNATIPGDLVQQPGIECFVLATSAEGVTRAYPDSRFEPAIRAPQVLVDNAQAPVVTLLTDCVPSNQPMVTISADVMAGAGQIDSVELFHRVLGQREFAVATMTRTEDGSFSAPIALDFDPSQFGLELVVIATNTDGVRGTVGRFEQPFVLTEDCTPDGSPPCMNTDACGVCLDMGMMTMSVTMSLLFINRRRRRQQYQIVRHSDR